MARLTAAQIKSLSPQGRDYRAWDDSPRGFGVRVHKSGSKSFIFRYRSPVRFRRVEITLGSCDALTLKKARGFAKEYCGVVAGGRDPKDERVQAEKIAAAEHYTIAQLCEDYMADAVEGRVLYRGRKKKARTLEDDRARIENHIKPLIGHVPIMLADRALVENFKHAVFKGSTARQGAGKRLRGRSKVSGGPQIANRVLEQLGAMFTYAVRRELIEANPASRIEKYARATKHRVIQADEYRTLERVLVEMENKKQNPVPLNAIRLIALTGCRRNEIFKLKWTEIDQENGCFRLIDSKTGPQVRPIGRVALDLLVSLPRLHVEYVFPNIGRTGPIVDRRLFAVARRRAGLEDVTLHTFRHSYASIASYLDMTELTIAGLLGHSAHSVTTRYIHQSDPILTIAANQVAAEISLRMKGAITSDNVIELKRSAG